MGNNCCSHPIKQKQHQSPFANFHTTQTDEPLPQIAKLVQTHIDVHPKVKQIHMIYKPYHTAERKGNKLPLHYLFDYCAYYEGEWKNGLPHGNGRLLYDDGSVYDGCFKQGIAECKDALFVKDETTFYKGSIKNNKANGYGELTTPKLFYKGHWVNDLPQGKARQIYSSSSFYEGSFLNGQKHGEGIYQWNKNEYYIGNFHKNLFDGSGDLTTKDYHYRGEFQMGQKQGKGTYKDLANKEISSKEISSKEISNKYLFVFVGIFKANRPSGEGKMTYPDGAVIKGYFDGFQNVKGTLTLPSGQTVPVDLSPTAASQSES